MTGTRQDLPDAPVAFSGTKPTASAITGTAVITSVTTARVAARIDHRRDSHRAATTAGVAPSA